MSEKGHLNNVFISGFGGYEELFPTISSKSKFFKPFIDNLDDIFSAMHSGGNTLMGWSTGAHIIAGRLPLVADKWKKIVLVAPFDDFTNCFGTRVIDAMIKGMDRDFHKTMNLFYTKCGIRSDFEADIKHRDVLKEGLVFLKNSKIKEGYPAENIIVIYGCNDQISKRTGVLNILRLFEKSKFMEVDQPHYISEDILVRFF